MIVISVKARIRKQPRSVFQTEEQSKAVQEADDTGHRSAGISVGSGHQTIRTGSCYLA